MQSQTGKSETQEESRSSDEVPGPETNAGVVGSGEVSRNSHFIDNPRHCYEDFDKELRSKRVPGNKGGFEDRGLRRLDLMKEIDLEADAQMEEASDSTPAKRTHGHGFQELTLSYLCNNGSRPVIDDNISKSKGKELEAKKEGLEERDFLQFKEEEEGESPKRCRDGCRSAPVDEELEGMTHKKLKTDILQLSLALPEVSGRAKLGGSVSSQGPVRSFQTNYTRTSSDGFTNSLDLSHSTTFIHNPSCSLTQNSADNHEYSVASYPASQNEHEWQLPDVIEPAPRNGNGGGGFLGLNKVGRDRDISLYQKVLQNGERNERQFSFPEQSVSSWDTKSIQHSKFLSNSNGQGKDLASARDEKSLERILNDIVSEPVTTMAQTLQDLPDAATEDLISYVKDVLAEDHQSSENLGNYQRTLQRRADLKMETLAKAHRVQLQIFVALKTGIPAFLGSGKPENKDLAEIYLNLKCRNSICLNSLPVDGCECKFCTEKNGFCSTCMCLLCLKFDFASETCTWVGCDVCMHWCHTDCALRKSYIRPSPSINGLKGDTEMQFHCMACGHSSEMYGFVKEVFNTCAKMWGPESLVKELDCVRRIFQSSEDYRGRELHNKARDLLISLRTQASAPQDVRNGILSVLNESDQKVSGTSSFASKEIIPPNRKEEDFNQLGVMIKESIYKINTNSVENIGSKSTQPNNLHDIKKSDAAEFSCGKLRMKSEMEELESIVRMKQAEAEMFQMRADGARREAEGLRRIAIAKNEKIDEEYTGKLARLCLNETNERRRQKFQELKLIETAHRDFSSMKIRMESDIKELLRKMDHTRHQFLNNY